MYNTYHNTVHNSFYCDILFHFSLHLLTFLTLPTYSFLPTLSRSLFLTIPSYLPPFHSLFLTFPSYFRPMHSLILPIPSYFPFTLSLPFLFLLFSPNCTLFLLFALSFFNFPLVSVLLFRNVILSLPYHLSLFFRPVITPFYCIQYSTVWHGLTTYPHEGCWIQLYSCWWRGRMRWWWWTPASCSPTVSASGREPHDSRARPGKR